MIDAAAKRASLFQRFRFSPGTLTDAIREQRPGAERAASGLWRRDPAVWSRDPIVQQKIADRLGWLRSPTLMSKSLDRIHAFADGIKRSGFTDVVLLGMGGSSLGPEVLAQTFGSKPGFPRLQIVDSTDPAQLRRVESSVDLGRTLFIVSSKSGSTLEPNILKQYFFSRAQAVLGEAAAAQHFVAITDPGSSVEKIAHVEHFRRVCHGVPTIGGRYSVLSDFGIVPAAAIGIDTRIFLERTAEMVRAAYPDRLRDSRTGAPMHELAYVIDRVLGSESPIPPKDRDALEQVLRHMLESYRKDLRQRRGRRRGRTPNGRSSEEGRSEPRSA